MTEITQAEAAAHKAKAIARGKLLDRFRCHIQEIVDHASDEGDRVYFGSTNEFEYLKDIVSEMDMWNWDTVIKQRGEIDPYAEMRTLRTECEKLRQIISDCASALPNGAHIDPACSLEFMQSLPNEIALVVTSLQRTEEKEVDECPICLKILNPDDLCAIDIELGHCHAACLEGSPVVDLNTGEMTDAPMAIFRYGEGK